MSGTPRGASGSALLKCFMAVSAHLCGAPRERNSEGPSLRGSFLLMLHTNNGTPNLRGPDMHGNRPGVHCAVFSREDALVRL